MALGPFRVGDQPADDLDLTIGRAGDREPLSGFTAAEIQLRKPGGTVLTWAGEFIGPDIVRSSWPTPSPFTTEGLHKVRAKLTGDSGVVELASWVRFWVRPA